MIFESNGGNADTPAFLMSNRKKLKMQFVNSRKLAALSVVMKALTQKGDDGL